MQKLKYYGMIIFMQKLKYYGMIIFYHISFTPPFPKTFFLLQIFFSLSVLYLRGILIIYKAAVEVQGISCLPCGYCNIVNSVFTPTSIFSRDIWWVGVQLKAAVSPSLPCSADSLYSHTSLEQAVSFTSIAQLTHYIPNLA